MVACYPADSGAVVHKRLDNFLISVIGEKVIGPGVAAGVVEPQFFIAEDPDQAIVVRHDGVDKSSAWVGVHRYERVGAGYKH